MGFVGGEDAVELSAGIVAARQQFVEVVADIVAAVELVVVLAMAV